MLKKMTDIFTDM